MGAYLSQPVVDKESEDTDSARFVVGACSMQGWRVSQEDAHNAILDYDVDSGFFAVYDGHGGHEVAEYSSRKLPDFIKRNLKYKEGNISEALIDSFVGFDETLVQRDVVAELKIIACKGEGVDGGEDEEDDRNELAHLCEEATMPIEDVFAKYGDGGAAEEEEKADEGGSKPKPANLLRLKESASGSSSKPISPFLRGKTTKQTENGPGNSHIKFEEVDDEIEAKDVKNEIKEEIKEAKEEAETKDEVKEEATDKVSEETKVKEEEPEQEKANGETLLNGHSESSENGDSSSTKGKGKGKGKGKSNLIKPKEPSNDPEDEPEEAPKPVVKKPVVKKTAQELYHGLISEEVVDEEDSESDEDDEDVSFNQQSSSDDDDEEEEGEDEEEDEEESDSEEDEEEEEVDGEQFIGGDFNEEPGNDSGCTAVVALIRGSDLYVANAGDSRCVVCRDGVAIEMSFDHKPEDEPERERIRKAGGRVTPDGRVNGGLNLSRALGDHAYKTNKALPLSEQMISPVPDVKTLKIDPKTDTFMVLACDGIWNSMSSQEVVDFVGERIKKNPQKMSSICEELFDHCLAPDTMGDGTGCDNMTAIVVKFRDVSANGSETNGKANHAADVQHAACESGDSKPLKRPLDNGGSEETCEKKQKVDEVAA